MVIGVLAKVVILTLAMQRCCNEFSGVLSVVAALFHRLLVSFISGLMGGHPVSNDQNPPTVRSSIIGLLFSPIRQKTRVSGFFGFPNKKPGLNPGFNHF